MKWGEWIKRFCESGSILLSGGAIPLYHDFNGPKPVRIFASRSQFSGMPEEARRVFLKNNGYIMEDPKPLDRAALQKKLVHLHGWFCSKCHSPTVPCNCPRDD